MEFRWNKWNLAHIGDHGISPEEAENVVRSARVPYPQEREDDKWLVWGRSPAGRYLQVVFVLDPDLQVFVIHARPLTEREKRSCRKRRRQ